MIDVTLKDLMEEGRTMQEAKACLQGFATSLVQDFPHLVATELKTAREKFPALHSAHEAYGVLAEELAEFFDQVRLRPALRDPAKMVKELVQLAAICQRAAEDLEGGSL